MKIDFKKMFDFSIITKFIKYDWKNIFAKYLNENDNVDTLPEECYNNLYNGAVLKCLAFIIYIIAEIIRTLSFQVDVSYAISEAIILFVILTVNKGKKENKLLYIILFVFFALEMLGSTLSIIKILLGMNDLIIFGIIVLVSTLITILADIHVMVGCLDFCNHINSLKSTNKKKDNLNKKNFCSKCGNKLNSKDNFCPLCGNKIKK